jgi:hypothetical protein
MVDYLKDNFLNGRAFAGLDDLASQGRLWLETSNARVHATTGERPCDLLLRENLAVLSLVKPYVLAQRHERKVDVEGFVHLGRTRYSVPPQYVGKPVIVIQSDHKIRIRVGDLVIAEHTVAPAGTCVAAKDHVEAMWKETLKRSPPPPEHSVVFTPGENVSIPPLSIYEEVAG